MGKLWGGRHLAGIFGRPQPTGDPYGEAWLISGYGDEQTSAIDEPFQGLALSQLLSQYGPALMGHKNYERFGARFPLLIKFIDAAQDLSIQVHPSDAVAHELGLESGKTEMWYVLHADPEAALRIGFSRPITPAELEERIHDGSFADVLARHPVQAGDCFLVPAGTIHSICGGTLLLEIQQSSDATFRVFDFNRRDLNGQLRPLHIAQAKRALDYSLRNDYRSAYRPAANCRVEMERTPFFTTSVYSLTRPFRLDLSADRFVVLIGTAGHGRLTWGTGSESLPLRAGSAVLLPAAMSAACVEPLDGPFGFVETFVE